jgi:hypothetical protein
MAEPGVEASVFQIPDLVGAANKQQQQKLLRQQQQDYRTQSFLSDFKEKQGFYLPAHRPVVQERFNDLLKAKDAYKINPSASNAASVQRFNDLYLNTAAYGQKAFNMVAEDSTKATQDPSKLSESVLTYMDRLNQYTGKPNATFEDMQFMVDNPDQWRAKVATTEKLFSPVEFGLNLAKGKVGSSLISDAKARGQSVMDLSEQGKAVQRFNEMWEMNYGRNTNPTGYAMAVLAAGVRDATLDAVQKEDGTFSYNAAQLTAQAGKLTDDVKQRLYDEAKQNALDSYLNSFPENIYVPSGKESTRSKLKLSSVRPTTIGKEEWYRQRNPYIMEKVKKGSEEKFQYPQNIQDAKLKTINFKPISDVLGNKIVGVTFEENDGKYYAKKSRRKQGEPVTDEMMNIQFKGEEGVTWTEEDRKVYQEKLDESARKSGTESKEIIYEPITERTNLDLLITGLTEPIYEQTLKDLNPDYQGGLGLDVEEESVNLEEAMNIAEENL